MTTNTRTTDALVADLRARVTGRVIAPGDDDYDEARTVFLGGIDRCPAAIVRVADDDDVAHVIGVARETGLELGVRSGGHSNAGHSTTDGGIVLDLSQRKGLVIDADGRTAWAETGLTAGELTRAAGTHGLAVGFGDTGSVGIGGITLGGGIGYLVRKHGLTIDSLLAADVVTADGRRVRTDAETEPDLFWAIRGGGGNFGVATRFRYGLAEVPSVVGGMLLLPATAETIASFIAAAEAAPEELTTIANVMPAPPLPFVPEEQHGRIAILALMAYAGDADAGERALGPFRALAAPIADLLRPMPYPEIYPPDEGDYHPVAVARTMFLDSVDRTSSQLILDRVGDHMATSGAQMAVVQLRVLGGAMARVSAEATAFAHRSSRIMANVAALHDPAADRGPHAAWVDGLVADLRQGDGGAYVNFLGDEGAAAVRAAYPGSTWDRLVEIKRRYDPGNVFRLNQNVPPA